MPGENIKRAPEKQHSTWICKSTDSGASQTGRVSLALPLTNYVNLDKLNLCVPQFPHLKKRIIKETNS